MPVVKNLEHVSYELESSDQTGDYYLVICCSKCFDKYRRPCTGHPESVTASVIRYGFQHVHKAG